MSAVETRQMSSAETGQMSTGQTGRCPVSLFYIWPVSAEDICLVSTADICPVSTADISISIHHSASAVRINNQHVMEAATAADLTQASEMPPRYITLGPRVIIIKGYTPEKGITETPWEMVPKFTSAERDSSQSPQVPGGILPKRRERHFEYQGWMIMLNASTECQC